MAASCDPQKHVLAERGTRKVLYLQATWCRQGALVFVTTPRLFSTSAICE